MRYTELSWTKFYSCYLQQCHSIDLFSYRTPGHGQKGQMNEACASFCSDVFLKLALYYFLQLYMVLGAHVMLCMTEPDFLKIMFFAPKMRKICQAQCSLKKFSFFFSVLFFINLVYIKSLCCFNSSMLEQISYLGKFWFLRYDPKSSWPFRLRDFSINRKTIKLALSYNEINEINCFLAFCESIQQFSQEWLIRFS